MNATAHEVVVDTAHRYRIGDAHLSGVTQVLRPIVEAEYAGVNGEVMQRAARLGSAVHRMIELDRAGDLDIAGLDKRWCHNTARWREVSSSHPEFTGR